MKKLTILTMLLALNTVSAQDYVGINNPLPMKNLDVKGEVRMNGIPTISALEKEKVVTVTSDGDLKQIDSKVFFNTVDQTINFKTTSESNQLFNATGEEDVIWCGNTARVNLQNPTAAQIKRGRIIHIVAAGGSVTFTNKKPVIANSTTLSNLNSGQRISIIPVNVFGGYAWYVISNSNPY